jgi:hypothetical protein
VKSVELRAHNINASLMLDGDLRTLSKSLTLAAVRDLETIDSRLRLLAAVRRVCREYDGRVPSTTLTDALLDDRAAASDGTA